MVDKLDCLTRWLWWLPSALGTQLVLAGVERGNTLSLTLIMMPATYMLACMTMLMGWPTFQAAQAASSPDTLGKLLTEAQAQKDWVLSIQRQLHQWPELM